MPVGIRIWRGPAVIQWPAFSGLNDFQTVVWTDFVPAFPGCFVFGIRAEMPVFAVSGSNSSLELLLSNPPMFAEEGCCAKRSGLPTLAPLFVIHF